MGLPAAPCGSLYAPASCTVVWYLYLEAFLSRMILMELELHQCGSLLPAAWWPEWSQFLLDLERALAQSGSMNVPVSIQAQCQLLMERVHNPCALAYTPQITSAWMLYLRHARNKHQSYSSRILVSQISRMLLSWAQVGASLSAAFP